MRPSVPVSFRRKKPVDKVASRALSDPSPEVKRLLGLGKSYNLAVLFGELIDPHSQEQKAGVSSSTLSI